MAERTHRYALTLEWQGNQGTGTSGYRDYGRSHEVRSGSKPPIAGTSDRTFRGDADRWSPEELLVAALSQCHMLWYLHLASGAGVVVIAYTDEPSGTMVEEAGGAGQFTEVVLRPAVTITDASMIDRAQELHDAAHAMCFIARSVNFTVRHEPAARVADEITSG